MLSFRRDKVLDAIKLYLHRPRMYRRQWNTMLNEAGDTTELNLSQSEKTILRDMVQQEKIWRSRNQ